MTTTCDILIVGAGPAGLALARSLARSGLEVAIVEQADLDSLKNPVPDGRAIALNHASMQILENLDVAQRFAEHHRSALKRAEVLDGPMGGPSPVSLIFDSARRNAEALGWLVPNHAIRRALFESFAHTGDARLMTGLKAECVRPVAGAVQVTLSDGSVMETRLLVAADTRFSSLRRQMGISAFMHDFGRTMIVTDMAHEKPHGGTALECFFHDMTLATLPLTGNRSSIVLTVKSHEAARLMAMDIGHLARDMGEKLAGRLGALTPEGERHAYPLVAVYAHSFHGERFALAGDAAVGMHPVTAHGFNFGLQSQNLLAGEVLKAHRRGLDIGAVDVLERYGKAHRRSTFPLFHATNGIASLYANDSAPARFIRQAGLRIASHLPPVKDMVISRLLAGPRQLH